MRGDKQSDHDLENQQVWNLLDELGVPEPDINMEIRFYGMLDHYKQTEKDKTSYWKELWQLRKSIFNTRPKLQLAYSILLVAFGVFIGYLLNEKQITKRGEHGKLSTLSNQILEMRKMMVVTLLENPSASERLRAVNYTVDMQDADRQVIAALLHTLNEDDNVNVRLVTLNALAKFSDQPEVRAALVNSIIHQKSPLVQVAMANLMVKLQEKSSLVPFKKLLEKQELNQAVKTKIERTINKLII